MTNSLKISGIDHPALAANDVDILADWYCAMFGYEKWFKSQPVGPLKSVWILRAPDGTLLEVMPKDDTARPERTGWSHLALRVDDFDTAVTFLDQQGVTWLADAVEAIGGGRVRTLADPDGNMLQVVTR